MIRTRYSVFFSLPSLATAQIFFIALFLSPNALGFEMEKTIKKDMTYDGVQETIIYKVWGESWDASDWSFEIYDGDEIIYQERSTAAYWKMTEDRGDWQDCPVIADCKRKAFSPDSINRVFEDIDTAESRYDFMLKMFIAFGPERYRMQFKVTEIEAEEHVKRLHDFLKGKQIIGLISPGNYGYSGLLTYDKYMETFVTFYTP